MGRCWPHMHNTHTHTRAFLLARSSIDALCMVFMHPDCLVLRQHSCCRAKVLAAVLHHQVGSVASPVEAVGHHT